MMIDYMKDLSLTQEEINKMIWQDGNKSWYSLPESLTRDDGYNLTWNGTDMTTEREQDLINLGFELALAAYSWNKDNPNVTAEQVAAWARNAFRECGFNVSDPVGQSWGKLDKNSPYLKRTDGKTT
jgi:hypothetical protein